MANIWARKSMSVLMNEATDDKNGIKRTLGSSTS